MLKAVQETTMQVNFMVYLCLTRNNYASQFYAVPLFNIQSNVQWLGFSSTIDKLVTLIIKNTLQEDTWSIAAGKPTFRNL